ncbi:MAG TPA: hypothetical protein VGQ57_07305 [Polyangiaceae bacterium]|nr:hypothetical protein [Polyangiaceae bacterium]
MAKSPGGRNIVNAVKETLDSVVTPSVRDTILARALAAMQREELPTDPKTLEEFLQGPLHDSLVKALGPKLGLSVSSELERITAFALRDPKPRVDTPARRVAETVRPGLREKSPTAASLPAASKRKPSRSTMPSPDVLSPESTARTDERWAEHERRGIAPTVPAGRRVSASEGARRESTRPSKGAPVPISDDYPRGVARTLGVFGTKSVEPEGSPRPTVLLASADPEMHKLFHAWLELRARVEPVAGATALIARLAQGDGARTAIVLDGRSPSIRPLTLAALADELPKGTSVVLWGLPAHVHARMCTISAAAEKWAIYAGDTTTNEIVAECARIVG